MTLVYLQLRRFFEKAAQLFFTFLFLVSCSKGGNSSNDQVVSREDLLKRGRALYTANCTACHGSSPEVDGALGPAVKDVSRELLEARVLRAEYPEGYQPKRNTNVMVPLPHLKSDLEALYEFLNNGSKN